MKKDKSIESKYSKEIIDAIKSSSIEETYIKSRVNKIKTKEVKKEVKEQFEKKFTNLDTSITMQKQFLNTIILKEKKKFDLPIIKGTEPFKNFVLYNTYSGIISFKNITLSKIDNTTPIALYAHEIAHVLQIRNPNVITNELDNEFLSIFMEKIINLETKNLEEIKSGNYNRYSDIKFFNFDNILNEKNIIGQTYYKSNLMAIYLFHLYLNFPADEKINMLKNIKEVFEGKMILENFSKIYNINLYNSELKDVIIDSIDTAVSYKDEYEKNYNINFKKISR